MGQMMRVFGLAWSGGYGVQRKTAETPRPESIEKIASMGLMGLGGLDRHHGGLSF